MSVMKILLAEDDVDDREFFYSFLKERLDIELLPAVENGVELFEYLGKQMDNSTFPGAIILDQNMPKLNGLQTLQMLKDNPRYAHIPVMMYTTYAEENLVQRSTNAGAIIVMEKPTTEQNYNNMVDRFIEVIG